MFSSFSNLDSIMVELILFTADKRPISPGATDIHGMKYQATAVITRKAQKRLAQYCAAW